MIDQEYSALASRNFRRYLYGNVFSVLGVWIQRLALGWHAWQLTESTFVVGIVAAAQFMPLLLLTPFFGVLVDQIRTRQGAIVMHAILTLIAAALGILTLGGYMTIEWLIALAFLHGIANSAYSPVRLALIPELVDKQKFPSAVAVSSMVFNLSRFVGPGIAGAIVAWYGLGFAYIVNAVTYLPVIVALCVIRIDETGDDGSGAEGGYFARLAEGIRYTRDHAPIRQVILLAGVSNFFGRGILELMPAFVAILFAGGSAELAALMAATGVGAMLASLTFYLRPVQTRLHVAVVIGAIGVCATMLMFSAVSALAAGVVIVCLLGFFASLVSIGSQTEVQLEVESRLRGRVMSLWTLAIIGGPALGSVVAGALAERFGASSTSLGFGVACLCLVLAVGLRKPDPETVREDDRIQYRQ